MARGIPKARLSARVLTAVLALALFLVGCQRAGSAKIVDTEEVTGATAAREVSADGTLEAVERVPVAPEISGKVSEVFVAEGQHVEAGQTLFTVDTAALHDQLSAVEGAGGGGGGGGGGGSSSDIETPDLTETFEAMNEAVAAQKLLLDQEIATINVDPGRTLPEKTIDVLTIEVEKVQLDLDNARFQTEVSTTLAGDMANAEGFAAFGGALGGMGGGGSSAQADAQAAELRRQIDAGTVTAPLGGIVSFVSASGGSIGAGPLTTQVSSPGDLRPGTLITAGQTVLTVYDISDVRVDVDVEEDSVPLVEVGQTADVLVDAFADDTFSGQVLEIAIAPTVSDTGETTYGVLLRIPANKLGNWRPGMTATVEIKVEEGVKGVELPAAAVLTREGQDRVFVVEGGKARERDIAEQPGSAGFVIVTSGLRPGDIVVTSGAEDLEEGDRVRTES